MSLHTGTRFASCDALETRFASCDALERRVMQTLVETSWANGIEADVAC
jgi:hypothetical protein